MRQFFVRKKVQLVAKQSPTAPTTTTVTSLPTSVHIPWQRMVVSILGIVVMLTVWERATLHLYSLPVTSVTAFTSITNNVFYTVAVLVVFFVTGKIFFDWKNATVSQVVQQAQNVTEEHIERVVKPKFFDDPEVT